MEALGRLVRWQPWWFTELKQCDFPFRYLKLPECKLLVQWRIFAIKSPWISVTVNPHQSPSIPVTVNIWNISWYIPITIPLYLYWKLWFNPHEITTMLVYSLYHRLLKYQSIFTLSIFTFNLYSKYSPWYHYKWSPWYHYKQS